MRSTIFRPLLALLLACTLPLVTMPVDASALAPPQEQPTANLNNDQLDSLVAPFALYPDSLLAQILVASTYPLEVIQLQQFLDRNPGVKDQALLDSVQKQGWDASVQALAPMPDVVKILSENIKWTTDLGNVFLAQENDVMSAVQRMRAKAQGNGQLKTTQQQTVEQKVVDNQPVIVIEQSSPQVVYVPTYDPMVVYGAPVYPYYPMTYPSGWYAAGVGLGFAAGITVGAIWGGGGWGWNCGWGGNNININNNNNFINHYNSNNLQGGNRYNGGNNNWQHDGSHRGGTPYGNRDVANRYGGNARGDSIGDRQNNARQNPGNFGQGNRGDYSRPGSTPGQGNFGQGGQMGQGNRGQAGQGGQFGQGNRGQGGMQNVSGGNRPTQMGGGNQTFGGNNRSGSRDVSRGGGNGAFGGAGSGMDRGNAGRSQSRGSSSMGRSSGGMSRGGGRSGGGGGRRR